MYKRFLFIVTYQPVVLGANYFSKKNCFIKVHVKLSKPGVKRIIRITVNADLIINVEDA